MCAHAKFAAGRQEGTERGRLLHRASRQAAEDSSLGLVLAFRSTAVKAGLKDSRLYASSFMTGPSLASADSSRAEANSKNRLINRSSISNMECCEHDVEDVSLCAPGTITGIHVSDQALQ